MCFVATIHEIFDVLPLANFSVVQNDAHCWTLCCKLAMSFLICCKIVSFWMHFVCPVENQWISNELERCHTRTATLRSVFSWQQGPVFWQPDEWFGWWNDLAGSYVVLVINASFFDGHFYFTFFFWKSGKQKWNHWPTRHDPPHDTRSLPPCVPVQYTTPTPVHHSVPVLTRPKDHHVVQTTKRSLCDRPHRHDHV